MECRKHNHHGSKGVCSSCLRDKLSRLPNNTTPYYFVHRSDLSPSPSSSTVSSSPSSPAVAVKDRHRRGGSMSFAVREALSEALTGGGAGLKKSRSIAHVPKKTAAAMTKTTEKLKSTKGKKSGFWTKLLHLKGKGGGADVGGFVTSRPRVC